MSEFDNLSEADKAAISAINRNLNDAVAEIFAPYQRARLQGSQTYEDGKPIEFDLPKGKNLWLYYRGRSGRLYCYTPWKCVRGWYYCFDYQPVGEGSRSGKATRHKLTNLVRFRKRKSAKERAIARWRKDT